MDNRLTIKNIIKDYLLILLAPFGLMAPILLRGQALFWGTPSLQFVPWWCQAWQGLLQGSLPLWNPNNGLGAPLLANYQAAFLYPPNWFLLGMAAAGGPPAIAWGYTILVVIHLAWAGLGMAVLLRRLSFSWFGQMLGGLSFGLSGFVVARMGFFSMVWVAAWLPWVIYFADQIAIPDFQPETRRPIRLSISYALTGCLAMQLLAGHAQLTWYSLILAGLWVTFRAMGQRGWRGLLQAMIKLALSAAISVGLAAVQLIPTFEYLKVSQRADAFAYEEALTYSFWPWRFLTLFAPDFFGSPARGDYWGYATYWEDHLYVGMLSILLALATLVLLVRGLRRPVKDKRLGLTALSWLLLLVSFILALGKFTPVFPFLYWWVPTFDMFQAPARYLIWAAFVLPILTAVGAEFWRCPSGRGLYWFRLATAGAFAVSLGAGLAWLLIREVNLTFVRATALAGVWGLGFGLLTLTIPLAQKHQKTKMWQWCVLFWLLADLLVTGWSLNPGVDLDFYAGQTQVGQELGVTAPGQRVYMSRQEEYDLKFKRFLRFKDFKGLENWRSMREVLIPNLNLLDGISLAGNFDPLVTERYSRWMIAIETIRPEARQGWLSLMNVGQVAHIDGRTSSGLRFDKLPEARRLHWYGCARPVIHYDEAWKILEKELEDPPLKDRAVVVETGGRSLGECAAAGQVRLRLESDLPTQVVIDVAADTGGWLVLADSWYPGWIARIDGELVEVFPADTLFRAVYIEPGAHKVIFLYRPTGFYFAGLFSILVLLLLMFLYHKRGQGDICLSSE